MFDFNEVNDWALSPYFTTSDDRLIEYGFRKIIFDECSKYQRVQICSTVDYGNLLILDGAINLAENDTEAYTNALMNLPHVSLDHYSHIDQGMLLFFSAPFHFLQVKSGDSKNIKSFLFLNHVFPGFTTL